MNNTSILRKGLEFIDPDGDKCVFLREEIEFGHTIYLFEYSQYGECFTVDYNENVVNRKLRLYTDHKGRRVLSRIEVK